MCIVLAQRLGTLVAQFLKVHTLVNIAWCVLTVNHFLLVHKASLGSSKTCSPNSKPRHASDQNTDPDSSTGVVHVAGVYGMDGRKVECDAGESKV